MIEELPQGFRLLRLDAAHPDHYLLALSNAISRLARDDAYLFEHAANERSICHKLALHLSNVLEASGSDLSVDCEYNRVSRTPDAIESERGMIKRLDLPERKSDLVYPDIIVHDRRSPDWNELVIEAKLKSSSGWRQRSLDFEKLRAYVDQLHYRRAVFLAFSWEAAQPRVDAALLEP